MATFPWTGPRRCIRRCFPCGLPRMRPPIPIEAKWPEQRALLAELAKAHRFGTIRVSWAAAAMCRQRGRRETKRGPCRCVQVGNTSAAAPESRLFMLTTACHAGEEKPDWFYVDVREAPWDGSSGTKLTAPWVGHGMTPTESHGLEFRDFPVWRIALPGTWRRLADAAGPFIGSMFTAAVLGIVQVAMATARPQLSQRAYALRPYEQVEGANAEQDAWLLEQAYGATLRAVETGPSPSGRSCLVRRRGPGWRKTAASTYPHHGWGTFARHIRPLVSGLKMSRAPEDFSGRPGVSGV